MINTIEFVTSDQRLLSRETSQLGRLKVKRSQFTTPEGSLISNVSN